MYYARVTRIVNYMLRAAEAQDKEEKATWLELADYVAGEQLSNCDLVAFYQLYDELVK